MNARSLYSSSGCFLVSTLTKAKKDRDENGLKHRCFSSHCTSVFQVTIHVLNTNPIFHIAITILLLHSDWYYKMCCEIKTVIMKILLASLYVLYMQSRFINIHSVVTFLKSFTSYEILCNNAINKCI